MDPERWERLQQLFDRAVELSGDQFEAFVQKECGDDAEMAELLRAALEESGRTDPFLRAPEQPPLAPFPEAGEVLGDLEFIEVIGRGAHGVVFRARQISLEREVAVKVVRPSRFSGSGRILREARTAGRLSDPGIVPVYFAQPLGELVAIAMELVDGHDLRQELLIGRGESDGPAFLPPYDAPEYVDVVVRLVAQAAEALAHAHEDGIVHRDVKPANLLLTADRRPRWVDFGIARDERFGAVLSNGLIGGAPNYVSPEQVSAADEAVDHRTDIYSLGVVLYELLTLEVPFHAETLGEVLRHVSSRDPIPPRRVNRRASPDVEAVCLKAMEKDRDDRYGTAREFVADLERCLRGEPPTARRRTSLSIAGRWIGRRRRVILALSGVVLASLLTAMFLRDGNQGRVRVSVIDTNGNPIDAPGGRVSARSMDLSSGVPGPRVPLGSLPLGDEQLDPGQYRFQVLFEDGVFAEATRTVVAGDELDVRVTYRSDASTAGMVRLAGAASFQPPFEADSLCPNAQRAVPVEPFWIDRYEVTNGAYREFVAATGHPPPNRWPEEWNPAWDSLPVIGITWTDALAYAEWAGKRLPSHSEWEFTARGAGPDYRRYPWAVDVAEGQGLLGNTQGPQKTVVATLADEFQQYLDNVVPVTDSRGDETPEGVVHLLGNVAEYTETVLVADPRRDPHPNFELRYVAGAWWDAQATFRDLRSHAVGGISPESKNIVYGFRCARSDPTGDNEE